MKIETHHSKLFFMLLIGAFFLLLIYSILIYSNKVFAEENDNQGQNLQNVSQVIPTSANVPVVKEKI
jgi:hypothetical protein